MFEYIEYTLPRKHSNDPSLPFFSSFLSSLQIWAMGVISNESAQSLENILILYQGIKTLSHHALVSYFWKESTSYSYIFIFK